MEFLVVEDIENKVGKKFVFYWIAENFPFRKYYVYIFCFLIVFAARMVDLFILTEDRQWFSFENQQSSVYVVNLHFSGHPDKC